MHTYVRIRLAWRGRATSKLPGPVRGLRHDGRVVCVCVCASVGHHSWDGPPRSCGAGLGVPAAADRRGGLVGQVPCRGLQRGPPDDSRRGALRSSQTPCPPKVKAGHFFDFRSRRLSGEGVACQDAMRTTCGYVSSHTCAFGAGPTLGDGGRPAYGHRVWTGTPTDFGDDASGTHRLRPTGEGMSAFRPRFRTFFGWYRLVRAVISEYVGR